MIGGRFSCRLHTQRRKNMKLPRTMHTAPVITQRDFKIRMRIPQFGEVSGTKIVHTSTPPPRSSPRPRRGLSGKFSANSARSLRISMTSCPSIAGRGERARPFLRQLHGSPTRAAEMGPVRRKSAALAAKPPAAHWNHPDGDVSLRRASPDQSNKPADDRPAEKQIHQENSHEIALVPRQYRREKVQNRGEKQESHVFAPFFKNLIPNSVLRSPLTVGTLDLARLFNSRYSPLLELAVNLRLLLCSFM
jgi:hypothetical protein